MNNILHNNLGDNLGEIMVGKIKTSMNIDEQLWNDFRIIVLQKEGGRKLSDVIENLIKQYIKKNGGTPK
jgi:metal-responsive CopG/Arc/MetJ family transcriptional regulator